MKKFLLLVMFLVTLGMCNHVFAEECIDIEGELSSLNNINSKRIIIRNSKDLEEMNKRDVEIYNNMIENIPKDIKERFYRMQLNNFSMINEKYENKLYNTENINTYIKDMGKIDIVSEFLAQNPEYSDYDREELEKSLNLLYYNPVVHTVRKFFSTNGYDLSLTFFNHSLTPNPAPATMDLIGKYEGMYSHVKGLLYNDGFVSLMINFSKNHGYETLSDSTYTFDQGDLYWAIHGFTWKRTRTAYDKAYFKIIDTYDFNKWRDIPGVVAGFSGTNDFEIEIYGLVKDGTLQ